MGPAKFVLVCLAAMLSLAAILTPTASASSCSASPFSGDDAGGYNLVIELSCSQPVTNGTISIGLNRDIRRVDTAPAVRNGSGSLACAGTKLDCTGSLDPGATARLRALVEPDPCVSPAFSGELTVAFGDGWSYGPQPLWKMNGCSGGGAEGRRGGHGFDPGGVFLGVVKAPPARAAILRARRGLPLALQLGVSGRVVVTIERNGKVIGRTRRRTAGGATGLVARLRRGSAPGRARIHVHVIPDSSEGLSETGERYFGLRLRSVPRG
jgi:hypothetical protein